MTGVLHMKYASVTVTIFVFGTRIRAQLGAAFAIT